MTMVQIEMLLLWMTLINFGLLLFYTVIVIVFRGAIYRMHSSMFGVDEKQVAQVVYTYMANLKVLVIVFNLVPLLAFYLLD